MKILFPRFLEEIRVHRLIEENDTVIAGFSGGKDSVTMVLLLQELQRHIRFSLQAAYFNHLLRRDSGNEEEWVRRFCHAHDLLCVVGSRHVRRFKEQNKLNLEHAASISRYDFFNQVASRYPFAKIATGHTRSDLVETFFIKLFRGSGLQGLSAIYQKKENTLIRPLLLFTTAEIESFLQRNRIEHYIDESNRDESFLRNRIRSRLMPKVREIEPDVETRVFRTVSLIQDEFDYFWRLSREVLAQRLLLGQVLPMDAFRGLHPALQRHVIREYIRSLKGNLLNIGLEHIEEIIHASEKKRGLSIPGIDLRSEKGYIFPSSLTIPDFEYIMKKPGACSLPEIGQQIRIRLVRHFRKPDDNFSITIPAKTVTFPLTVRSAHRNDAYRKIHAAYPQKVWEMIRSSGMPHQLRRLRPVIVNNDGRIVWVYGSPLAHEFSVQAKQSPPFFRITFLSLVPGRSSGVADKKGV